MIHVCTCECVYDEDVTLLWIANNLPVFLFGVCSIVYTHTLHTRNAMRTSQLSSVWSSASNRFADVVTAFFCSRCLCCCSPVRSNVIKELLKFKYLILRSYSLLAFLALSPNTLTHCTHTHLWHLWHNSILNGRRTICASICICWLFPSTNITIIRLLLCIHQVNGTHLWIRNNVKFFHFFPFLLFCRHAAKSGIALVRGESIVILSK